MDKVVKCLSLCQAFIAFQNFKISRLFYLIDVKQKRDWGQISPMEIQNAIKMSADSLETLSSFIVFFVSFLKIYFHFLIECG